MNIFSLDDYRKAAEDALKGTGAFVRLSRDEGLFVTDAKRRNADVHLLSEKLPGFKITEKNDLLYLTPDYGFDEETNELLTLILKSDKEKQEKLIRQNLSKAMRLKNREQITILTLFYERMIQS